MCHEIEDLEEVTPLGMWRVCEDLEYGEVLGMWIPGGIKSLGQHHLDDVAIEEMKEWVVWGLLVKI